MKGKILTILFLALALIIVISLGYDTVYTSPNGISLKNLVIKTYSENKATYGFAGQQNVLSALKGYSLSWSINPPSETLDQSDTDRGTNLDARYDSWIAQTFTASNSGTLTNISVYMETYSSIDLIVELHENSPSGTLLKNKTVSHTLFSTSFTWVNITYTNDNINIISGMMYCIVLYPDTTDTGIRYTWEEANAYSGGTGYVSSNQGSSWTDLNVDLLFKLYISNTSDISSYMVTFDYSLSSSYTVAYQNDIGKKINTFNYTINIYHNVDSNQSWVLAYSTSYTNVTSISSASYSSPWISLLSGTYTTDYHTYYYKVEVVVEAFDAITGQQINNIAYVILSDQFYWQSYMSFNPQVSIVESNMVVQDVVQPYSIILAMMVILSYFIVRKRMMERD